MELEIVRLSLMSSLPNDAVVVAIGTIAQSELKKIASPVVVDDDNLLLGPSSSDPRRHRAVRACPGCVLLPARSTHSWQILGAITPGLSPGESTKSIAIHASPPR
ncbi:hypothetical protein WME79_49320 [Sorangium sp. So ce726]|uniref:hypothetical protein n=1 Tax=Sorangium sp. So ce726 TaxID=3133319 RepID=UPI003F5D7F22